MPIFNLKEILELMDKVSQSGLGSLEVESSGMRLKIEGKRSEAPASQVSAGEAPAAHSHAAVAARPALAAAAQASAAAAGESEDSWHIVTSPIVGTFYRTPNPESDPFVVVGDHITKGKVVCIIEAMKLMNEIESDSDGVIVKIYPQNGQPVEFGEKLFALKAVE